MSKINKKELLPQDIEQYMDYVQPTYDALYEYTEQSNKNIIDNIFIPSLISLVVCKFLSFITFLFLPEATILNISLPVFSTYIAIASLFIAITCATSSSLMHFDPISLNQNNSKQNNKNSFFRFNKKQIKKFINFKNHISKLIKNPHYHHTMSMIANYYESKEDADEYRIELFDFFENIKKDSITQNDINFFIEQHEFLMDLEQDFIDEQKIKTIKSMETEPQHTPKEQEFNFVQN